MVSLIRSVYRELQDRRYIGALFNWQGMRLEGEPWIQLDVISEEENPEIWWFRPKPMEDYQYVRMPVNAGSVIEVLKHVETETHPSVEYFRYVATLPPGHLYSGDPVPNARANFMVFAYRAKDLLRSR